MADSFYQPNVQEEVPVEKIKLGDDEYSQEELTRLVGLGKIGLESEQKYKTKLDRVWPQFQSIVNEKREIEEKYNKVLQERQQEAARVQASSQQAPQQLTPEQIKMQAIRQAEELGIGPQAIRQTVLEVIQGQQLLTDINTVIDTMTADGLPDATTEDILNHMQTTGIRNPEKAYKDMFEKEYLDKQAEKLAQIKRTGMPTISQSIAGSKQPAPVRVTKDNLDDLVTQALFGGGQ